MKIYLRDLKKDLCEYWSNYFNECNDVEVSCGDIFADGPHMRAEALVSPANSFTFMDGGIDYTYSEFLGWDVGNRLRDQTWESHKGEVPVGDAVTLNLECLKKEPPFKYLISAPTMRTPCDVSKTVNAYLAFSATLREAAGKGIESILCPGLGTAVGCMHPEVCALQMYEAYRRFHRPSRFAGLNQAHVFHYAMLQPKVYNEYLLSGAIE